MSGPLGSSQWMYSTSAFTIDQSLRFDDDSSTYLNRTPGSASNRKTWTFSTWMKMGNLVGSGSTSMFAAYWANSDNGYLQFGFDSSDRLGVWGYATTWRVSSQAFRDPGAWYHIVLAVDTTNDTAQNRIRVYINGSEITDWSTNNTVTEDLDTAVNYNGVHYLGSLSTTQAFHDGYLAEVHLVDGTQLTPASFGETDDDYGHWKPKRAGVTHGTNGFRLDFSNSAALGDDAAGSNDWTVNNLGAMDQVLDSPSNNFAVWNPNSKGEKDTGDSANDFVLSEGNLKNVQNGESYAAATIRPTSGKWYCEAYIIGNSSYGPNVRFVNIDYTSTGGTGAQNAAWNMYFRETSSELYRYSETTADNSPLGSVDLNAGNILQWAWDCDTGKVWIGNNNSNWRDASKGTTGDPEEGDNPTFTLSTGQVAKFLTPSISAGASTETYVQNFGQDGTFAGNRTLSGSQPYSDSEGNGSFFYEPPDGFLAVCTKNLPEPSFKPKEHFDMVLYTGNGGNQTISGYGFQPDLVISGCRSASQNSHVHDAVRGVENRLSLTAADAEQTDGALKTFTSDGYTFDTAGAMNTNTETYVNWSWKANGAGGANTDGSTNSTVSVNTTAGFSIVAYTGTSGPDTIGHGLGAIPQVIIVKDRTTGNQEWLMYNAFNTDDPETDYLRLDGTGATADNTFWNDTSPTSTVFSVGDSRPSNSAHGDNYIAYCWTPIAGYSNFGKYQGNGNPNGTFVYTGFQPAFVMTKAMTRSGNWTIKDTSGRTAHGNEDDSYAFWNAAGMGTGGAYNFDMLSNGFKWRNADENNNDISEHYLYMAFAEVPIKYANAL